MLCGTKIINYLVLEEPRVPETFVYNITMNVMSDNKDQ